MRTSHSSSSAGGRAFSAGNDPTMPALHCAITRSGTEIMNSGAPITGIDRRPLNKAGMDIRKNPLRYSVQVTARVMRRSKDARHHTSKAIGHQPYALLTQRAGNEIFGPAVARPALVARQVDFCGGF